MLGLVHPKARKLVAKHLEVVADRCLDLVARPIVCGHYVSRHDDLALRPVEFKIETFWLTPSFNVAMGPIVMVLTKPPPDGPLDLWR